MAEYAGSAVYVTWIHPGGTLIMRGECRSCNVNNSGDTIDATAGQDSNRVYLPSFANAEITWEGVAQDNSGTPAGTAYAQALAFGVSGTIEVGPYGTASNALKYSMPAFSLGFQHAMPYADVATLSTSWQCSSGGSLTVGAYT